MKLEKDLVLYDFREYLAEQRFKIECSPKSLAVKKDGAEYIWQEGCTIQGRHDYPENEEIPLRVYLDEDEGQLSDPIALIKVIWQRTVKTGRGGITNLEYLITRLPERQ